MVSEDFDNNNEFHRHVAELNHAYGRGEVLAIVWSKSVVARMGVYVVQLQYGVAVYHFRVILCSNGYTLKARGHSQSRVSDYFDDTYCSILTSVPATVGQGG